MKGDSLLALTHPPWPSRVHLAEPLLCTCLCGRVCTHAQDFLAGIADTVVQLLATQYSTDILLHHFLRPYHMLLDHMIVHNMGIQ